MEFNRSILHVDMDAFYASVEVMDNPSLGGKPVLVGATPQQRGVVAACSYEARTFGVHSAMPTSQALRLCPKAILLPVRMNRYIEVSRQIHQIFQTYTPQVESVSIDEAFLDVTGCIRLFGPAGQIAQKIKTDIRQTIGLTASVGVAPNKFLAKLASDLRKPDGFVVITEENKQEILDPLPVSKIWGIGKVTNKALEKAHIKTILQLRTAPACKLSMIFGHHAEEILKLAQGIDHRKVEPFREAKSISAEETFPTDIQDQETLLTILTHQVEQVGQRLRAEKLQAQTVTLKFRYGNFKTVTRSVTIPAPAHTTQTFLHEAQKIFLKWHQQSAGPLRLLGFGVSGLSPEGSGQRLLFADAQEEKQTKIDSAFDKITAKYGRNSLKRGQ